MVDKAVVTPDDLNAESFHIPRGQNQYRVRVNPDNDNLLYSTSTGLKVPRGFSHSATPQKFQLVMNTATTTMVISSVPTADRNYLYALPSGVEGIGVLIMNFTARSSSRVKLADLPTDAPTPIGQLAMKDTQGGQIWIEAGSRAIMGSGLAVNQQILVNLTGGFN